MTARNPKAPADNRRYSTQPVVGVGVVVWRGDKVLLVKRGKAPRLNEWGLPGGAQELGETFLETARREVHEETGLVIHPLGVITVLDALTYDKGGEIEYHYTIIEVAAESCEGDPRAADDVKDVCFATLDEVQTLCAWPEVMRVVRLSLLQKTL